MSKTLLALARRERGLEAVIEDACQETLWALLTRNTFTPERGDEGARAYLRRALKNNGLTLLGREGRYVALEVAREPDEAQDRLGEQEQEAARWAWIEQISARFDQELVPSVAETLRSDGGANFRVNIQAMRQLAAEETTKDALIEAELRKSPLKRGGGAQTVEGARDALDRRFFNTREKLGEALRLLREIFEEEAEHAPHRSWIDRFSWFIKHIDGFDGVAETLRQRKPGEVSAAGAGEVQRVRGSRAQGEARGR